MLTGSWAGNRVANTLTGTPGRGWVWQPDALPTPQCLPLSLFLRSSLVIYRGASCPDSRGCALEVVVQATSTQCRILSPQQSKFFLSWLKCQMQEAVPSLLASLLFPLHEFFSPEMDPPAVLCRHCRTRGILPTMAQVTTPLGREQIMHLLYSCTWPQWPWGSPQSGDDRPGSPHESGGVGYDPPTVLGLGGSRPQSQATSCLPVGSCWSIASSDTHPQYLLRDCPERTVSCGHRPGSAT